MGRKEKGVVMALSVVVMAGIYGLSICDAQRAFNVAARIPLIGWLVAHNLRPSDYFVPLAEAAFVAGECKLDFEFKYIGRHEIQIWPITDDTLFENSVSMDIAVESSDGSIMVRRKKGRAGILGGELLKGTNVYNYCYAIFDVPRDLPVGVKLTTKIRCWGDVSEVKRLNPDAKIVIRKMPDK